MSNDVQAQDARAQLPPARRFSFIQVIIGFFAFIGVLALIYLVTGLAVDIGEFDETSGGYDYPFVGWTGTPIDFSDTYTTNEGMYKRGRVIELYFNCETGMVSWRMLGLGPVDWRAFSDRAKVVHQPQVACRERGFDTSAWESINDPDDLFPELRRSLSPA